MNNVSKTIMTIAVAGSLLFGNVGVSSAELSKAIDPEREQINGLDNLWNGFHDGAGEPDPLRCQGTGKIYKILMAEYGSAHIYIYSKKEDKYWEFQMPYSNSSRQWDLIKYAYLQNLELTLWNNNPCGGVNGNFSPNILALWIESSLTEE